MIANLRMLATAGTKNIIENSKPLQKVQSIIKELMAHSGFWSSLSALVLKPNTLYPTVSDVYLENKSWNHDLD